MELDRPDVIAEVAAAFAGYEAALVANNADQILGFFHESVGTVRFGLSDHQVGTDEQRQWRSRQPPLPAGRRLSGTRISTFGTAFAVVTTFFGYPGSAVTGRQSQAWVRLPVGWRIVSAHVSEPATNFERSKYQKIERAQV